MEYYTTNEISKKWDISSRRVATLCETGRLKGAIKKGKTWLIPSDIEKPKDERFKRNKHNNYYSSLEKKYRVVYPNNTSATYSSLLNYSDDLNKPFQRWYRYKEGFSIELVEYLIQEYASQANGKILDPFVGSGSTLIAANNLGYSGIGFETNPFSFFLSKCKLEQYSDKDKEIFKKTYEKILQNASNKRIKYQLPKLSISDKVFNKEVESYYMRVGELIDNEDGLNNKVQNLLKLGWLSCLEALCNYRKAGNGLKIRKYAKPRIITEHDARIMLLEEYQNIYIDILKAKRSIKNKIYQESCLEMENKIENNSVQGIIFSPPYANCFDYTEIYKLELWFGKFVSEYSDLRELRSNSLHSHLNGDLDIEVSNQSDSLNSLLIELNDKDLWDNKIPRMLNLYYNDMFQVIDRCYNALEKGGFCCIVVGNSAYGGIVFPTDLLLAEYAERIGFVVDKIEVDRFIITSSQQYKMTKEMSNYLRESVVCLKKK